MVLLFACLRVAGGLFLGSGGNVFQGDADLQFYRSIGELSLAGHFPYVDYWMEYPPVFPWVVVGLYQLSLLLPAWPNDLLWFQALLSTLLACFDVGNLILVYGLAGALHGRRTAVRAAWMYGLLFFPLFTIVSWFDTIPLFFLLLTLWLALKGRAFPAGAAAGLGFMVKITPIVAAPVALLSLVGLSARARFAAALTLVVAAIAAPFAWHDPTMLVASGRFIAFRQSWETIWALFEGYYGTGRVPLLASRFDPQMTTWQLHPSTLPWSAITGVFLALCLLLYTRRLAWSEPRIAIPAAALTLDLFLLFSKGYSPQFLIYPLALLVVILPSWRGAAFATLLTANNLVEWPFAFGFFGDNRLAWLVVITRTVLLVWLGAEYAGLLFAPKSGAWKRLRRWIGRLVIVLAVIAIGAGVVITVGHYFAPTRPDDAVALADYLSDFTGPGQAAVATTRDAFYQIRPRVAVDRWVLGEGDPGEWPTSVEDRIAAARNGESRVWLIVDQAGTNQDDAGKMIASLDRWGSRATDLWFGRYHLLGYLASASAGPESDEPLPDVFGGAIALRGYELSSRAVAPGRGLTLALSFEARGTVGKDYKVFVHLVNLDGEIVAQHDRPLLRDGQGSAAWKVGETDREGYDLLVPTDLACGDYALRVGVYDPTNGQRLKVTAGAHLGDDKVDLGSVRVCGGGTR